MNMNGWIPRSIQRPARFRAPWSPSRTSFSCWFYSAFMSSVLCHCGWPSRRLLRLNLTLRIQLP